MVSLSKHPARLAAKAAGLREWSGPDCAHGHGGMRYTSSGTCAECSRIAALARRNGGSPVEPARKRVAIGSHPARLAAAEAGATHWHGPACEVCNGTLRYVKRSGSCVECNRRHGQKVRPRKTDDPAWHEARERQKADAAERRKRRERERRKSESYRAWRREYDRSWRAANPLRLEQRERKLERDAAYREANRTLYREAAKAWKRENAEAVRAHHHTRRARTKGAEGAWTPADIKRLAHQQGGECAYCTNQWEHVDHVIPLALGGTNWPSNLQLLCSFHNISKGARTDQVYREAMGWPPIGKPSGCTHPHTSNGVSLPSEFVT